MVLHDGPVIRSPHAIAPPTTPAGDQRRDEFVADILAICGDVRLLWLPKTGDTTTTTDASRKGRTFTYDATIAARLSALGSGLQVVFDGSDDKADVTYNADFFFGNSVADEAFSVIALVEADDATPTAAATIMSVWNKDTDGEQRHWRAFLTATNGHPTLEVFDESANAFIGRKDQTPLTANAMTLLAFTYDGNEISAGINVFVDAAELDDAVSESGSYVATEDPGSTEKVLLGHTLSALANPVAEEFWAGNMAMVALTGGALSADDIWAIKALVNAFFDLSL